MGENCSFSRRMGSIVYDSLLLFSLMLFATLPYLLVTGGQQIDPNNIPFKLYLSLIGFLYFILPWKIKGQTLGMQSWKIKLVQSNGQPVFLGQAILRMMYSFLSWLPLGAGYLWSLIDQEKLAVHDRLSRTKLISLKAK